ncbi:MAG: VOC family protein [Nitrospirae bacterium]|nr:VOC family protein [Candidatus Manganitrophaceae bacterium]
MQNRPTTFIKARFVIAVPDLQSSAEFYGDVLGFNVREIGDEGWRLFERDDCVIMAGECPDAIPPAELGDHAYFAYIVVSGIEAFYRSVQAKNADIIKRLCDEPWGMQEFGIRTIDGHRMMFGAPNDHDR